MFQVLHNRLTYQKIIELYKKSYAKSTGKLKMEHEVGSIRIFAEIFLNFQKIRRETGMFCHARQRCTCVIMCHCFESTVGFRGSFIFVF